jgi:hypothetical protein
MRRRELIVGMTRPLLLQPALAQQSAVPTVGFISIRERPEATVTAIRQGLGTTG